MSFPNAVQIITPTAASVSGTGPAWNTPGNAADGDEGTAAYLSGTASGSTSEALDLTGFDLTWFDSTNLDMTGVTLWIKYSDLDPGVVEFGEIRLVDNTGAPFGPDVASSATVVAGSNNWLSIEIATAISQTIYSSSSFGVRLRISNISAASGGGQIHYVEAIPTFERKVVQTGNYGVEFFDSAGNSKLSISGAFTRLVHFEHVAGGFTGTINLPNFDDTKGVLLFVAEYAKFKTDDDTQQAASYSWTSSDYLELRGHGMELPAIVFDNTTKDMTVSTGGNYPLPAGFETSGDLTLGWAVIAIHYR